MKSLNDLVREVTTWGTPACGAFCAVLGAVAAILILTVGFWQTVLVAALCAVGGFIGGVKEKQAALKRLINRLLPPKDGM